MDDQQRRERACELWRTSTLTATQIAKELGLTKGIVIGLVARRGVTRDHVSSRITPAEKQAKILAAVESGGSVRELAQANGIHIATIYGWCRDACIVPSNENPRYDAAARAIRRRELYEQAKQREIERQRRVEEARLREMQRQAALQASRQEAELIAAAPEPEDTYVVTLFQLRHGQCRDVQLGGALGGRYCAKPVKPGRSFCPHHAAKYFVKPLGRVRPARNTNYTPRNSRILEDA